MPNITVYSTSSDGGVANYEDNNYPLTHNAADGKDVNDSGTGVQARNNYAGIRYYVERIFLFFDTSGLGAGVTVTVATLSLYGYGSTEANTDQANLGIVEGVQGDPLAVDDFGDHLLKTTLGADSYYEQGTWNASGYNDKGLNATGRGWINKTGTTKFCLRLQGDIENSTPTGNNYMRFWVEEKGTGYKPKLVITYIPAVTFVPRFVGVI